MDFTQNFTKCGEFHVAHLGYIVTVDLTGKSLCIQSGSLAVPAFTLIYELIYLLHSVVRLLLITLHQDQTHKLIIYSFQFLIHPFAVPGERAVKQQVLLFIR